MAYEIGTKENPIVLQTPPLSSEYTMHIDQKDGQDILVSNVTQSYCI
jgi:hypothetical protein